MLQILYMQGGPHEHQIAAVACQLGEVMTPEFKHYAQQVKSNAKALAARLHQHGYTIATGGTDNHIVLVNLRPQGLTGSKAEKVQYLVAFPMASFALLGSMHGCRY